MKKITVTIITAAEAYPGTADILGICPEIELTAQFDALHERGVAAAVAGTDVLVLDERVLTDEGAAALCALQHDHPRLRLLLILENDNENKTLEALALGFSGVIPRASLRFLLRKAIPALYTGETWVSRRVVRTLRYRLLQMDSETTPGLLHRFPATHERLN